MSAATISSQPLPPPPPPQHAAAASGSAPAGQVREPHALSLKVLRAARPSLVQHAVLPYYETTSLGGDALARLDGASIERPDDFVLSTALSLPSTFGTIYLGETFSALLSLSHDLAGAPQALSPVLKVEMHTGVGATPVKHHLKTIYASDSPEALLNPGQSVEGLVQHEVKELGLHALVCTVTYGVKASSSASTVSRSFRKVYKFQVSNPLSVRTKAYAPTISTGENKIFLEVQVHNHTPHALNFTRMHLDPVPTLKSTPILPSPPVASTSTGATSSSSTRIEPTSIMQLLFLLTPTPSQPAPPAPTPGTSQPLGKLDLVWTSPHGEVARLQTSMLGRRVPEVPEGAEPYTVTILSAPPKEVHIHSPFAVHFRLNPPPSSSTSPAVKIKIEHLPSASRDPDSLLVPHGKGRVTVAADGSFQLGWLPVKSGLVENVQLRLLRESPITGTEGGDAQPVEEVRLIDSGLSTWVTSMPAPTT